MARLTNAVTGVTVNVSDEKVARLGAGWESADAEPKRGPGRPKKSEKTDEK